MAAFSPPTLKDIARATGSPPSRSLRLGEQTRASLEKGPCECSDAAYVLNALFQGFL
jgi:hypothetical protein